MKIKITIILTFLVLILGYVAYVDAQTKKRQELLKIVQDAESSLNTIQHSPHTHLSSYQRTH
ncbi:hypothetical protein GCM10025882_21460 [Acinetobacter gyllenbergii]|uniref:Uncharacterized protein n=1 Tax=Acinetobacter gyllenbergii CIP 110306 = MTCC 11365 TaxID=1217657 RepID=A0A829HJ74_9GAMM|nr:hypothetical protein [Acinetobacter gyllenbergii]EPF87774.1 hypothetical protein F957_01644 [Acinetobacter gyllenbergii CIP 110306 = MTCC 11365]EPH34484.1 hypothetical protein L293_3412 [Acinetobacter gyllenbergii CIP 110306 = MTCC 11365]ESK50678.1 hypothetical protein F987_01498 [Acinetobacter gyllenbergii NIPH 230]OBY75773.1 hypothetical protein NG55_03645 [Acinetobacter gyllenbergii]GMA11721.1 hypothetical protein GCM10025882_21460 [Acinetobacter gyllenbergii]